MSEMSVRYKQFQRENELYHTFMTSKNLSTIESYRSTTMDQDCWLSAFGKYLKAQRSNPTRHLFAFVEELLKEILPFNLELLSILKQCVHLFADRIHCLAFQRHLTQALPYLNDPYLTYRYVRLIRLILDHVETIVLPHILPSNDELIKYYHQLDHSIVLVLQRLVLIHVDVELQQALNTINSLPLIVYLKSNDFDDDELIEFCSIQFQISRHTSINCASTTNELIQAFFIYIDYEIETMINWLLTPETGEHFLIFILRLIKYVFSNANTFESTTIERLRTVLEQFHQQLHHAWEKSLFPYNIKPLLNAFQLK
jgi:hypothetical protein